MKKAFTMVELIFVIVIIGILASVAIPKIAASRDDAKISVLAAQAKIAFSDIHTSVLARGVKGLSSETIDEVTDVLFQDPCGTPIAFGSPLVGSNMRLCDGKVECIRFIVGPGAKSLDITAKGVSQSSVCRVLQNLKPIQAMAGSMANRAASHRLGGAGIY